MRDGWNLSEQPHPAPKVVPVTISVVCIFDVLLIWWVVRTLDPIAVIVAPVILLIEILFVVAVLVIARHRIRRTEASTAEPV